MYIMWMFWMLILHFHVHAAYNDIMYDVHIDLVLPPPPPLIYSQPLLQHTVLILHKLI